MSIAHFFILDPWTEPQAFRHTHCTLWKMFFLMWRRVQFKVQFTSNWSLGFWSLDHCLSETESQFTPVYKSSPKPGSASCLIPKSSPKPNSSLVPKLGPKPSSNPYLVPKSSPICSSNSCPVLEIGPNSGCVLRGSWYPEPALFDTQIYLVMQVPTQH
jgi:hypothetical protein